MGSGPSRQNPRNGPGAHRRRAVCRDARHRNQRRPRRSPSPRLPDAVRQRRRKRQNSARSHAAGHPLRRPPQPGRLGSLEQHPAGAPRRSPHAVASPVVATVSERAAPPAGAPGLSGPAASVDDRPQDAARSSNSERGHPHPERHAASPDGLGATPTPRGHNPAAAGYRSLAAPRSRVEPIFDEWSPELVAVDADSPEGDECSLAAVGSRSVGTRTKVPRQSGESKSAFGGLRGGPPTRDP